MTEVHPVTKAAQALSSILVLNEALREQAIYDANAQEDQHSLPGGKAMVALAHVANHEAWANRYYAAERLGRDATYIEVEDDTWEPPLQTLCFWSEQWRAELGAEYGRRPTIETEAKWLKFHLDWAWDNELHFADFARDLGKARVRLENILCAGERPERGVPCMYDTCGGVRLQRHLLPKRDAHGRKVWDWSDWRCKSCKRTWDNERYWANVNAANEKAQREEINGETWVSVDYAARDVGRSPKTIRTWIDRREVPTVCIVLGRRAKFVSLGEVRKRDAAARRRGVAA